MKRLTASLLCVLFLFFVPINTNAEEVGCFENAGELYEYWSKNSLPDFITGVWSSDGGYINLTFGVTNDAAGREGAKRILALVSDDDTVAIVYQTYSLHYLYDIQAVVEKYLDDDIGFKTVGVYFLTNRVEVDIEQERIDDPKTIAIVNALTERFGNAVFFRFTNAKYIPTIGQAKNPVNNTIDLIFNNILLYVMIVVCVICLAVLFFTEYKRRKLFALLTNLGCVTMSRSKASYGAIENAVKGTSAAPSPGTDAGILNAIENSKER